MRTRVTPRDAEVINWIAILRYLSTSLISQFFFAGNIKVCRRRLACLAGNGYLSWFEKQDTSSRGRWERVFYLNKKRREKIKYLLHSDNISFYRPPKNLFFVRHNLEVARFVLTLKVCCEAHKGYSFLCLPGHKACSVKKSGNEGLPFIGRNKASFVPDFLIILQSSLGKAILFLEIDTGKESIVGSFKNKADFTKKIKAYMDYLACRGYRRLSKRFNFPFKGFRIAIVTTASRLRRLAELCREIDTQGVAWLTTFDKVTSQTLFSPIWHVPCANKKGLQAIVKKNQTKSGERRQ